ncbi:MAG TPA: hypothetical protein VL049_22440 [Candidatus Dormibacteraeota bacterium]|nr:hypothetical protein [Candidatus Dormibacteraeota bacterium]
MSTSTLQATFTLPADHVLRRGPSALLGLGVLGLAVLGAGALIDREQFFRSYLVAFMFWGGIAFGCFGLVALNHIAGGRWGIVIRRICEAGVRTLPLVAVLFLPLLLGMQDLYEWADPSHVAHDTILQYKSWYLNTGFFVLRAAIYFAVWMIFARFLLRSSLEQDATGSPETVRKLQLLGRGAIVAYALTMTFAAVDWMMSIEPHWYSTMYSLLVIAGQVLSAFAFAIAILTLLTEHEPVARVATTERFHDLGNMLLAFVMIYAYFAFSQFLIIWSGNIPEETPWYLKRITGGWVVLAVGLPLFHFFLPFFVLLSRKLKKNPRRLIVVAVLMLVVRLLDLFWMIAPAFSPGKFVVHWMDIAAVLGVGGVWMAAFLWQLQARPILPLHDPALPLEASA